jgi:hypothetical protein
MGKKTSEKARDNLSEFKVSDRVKRIETRRAGQMGTRPALRRAE